MVQAVAEPIESVVLETPDEAQPQTNRAGRPPSLKKRIAQEASEEERSTFFEQTSALTDGEWEHHILYVYQWAPIVDLTKGGLEKKYRRIYTNHRNEEDIKRDLGSGTYQLKLNRTDPKTRKEKTINSIVISILDFEFPPNIPPGAWLDDPRNSDWNWAKPLLEKKFNVRSQGSANGGSAPTWAEMMQFLQANNHREPGAKDQVMASVVSILPQLLQQQTNAQDPGKVITALKEAKEFMSPPPDPNSGLLAILLPLLLKREPDPMLTLVMQQLTAAQAQVARPDEAIDKQPRGADQTAEPHGASESDG